MPDEQKPSPGKIPANYQDPGEIAERFLELEKELDLFDVEAAGHRVWEHVRWQVFQILLRSTPGGGRAWGRPEPTFLDRLASRLQAAKSTVLHNPLLAPESEILFYGHPRRQRSYDGRYWDLYCDPILPHLVRSWTYVESAYQGRHLGPARTSRVHHLDPIQYLAALGRKAKVREINLSDDERNEVRHIAEQLEAVFGVQVKLSQIIEESLSSRARLLPLYRKLLQRVNPNLVVLVVSYGNEVFIEACRIARIPVAELQHGVIHPGHVGYRTPKGCSRELFPDHFLSFGSHWEQVVDLPIPDSNIHTVGYPYLELMQEVYKGRDRGNRLVVLSNPPSGERLLDVALELSRDPKFPLEIVFRLHPAERKGWRDRYRGLASSDITVHVDDRIPLHEVLATSRAQLGTTTTALYEGSYFGLDTFVLDGPGRLAVDPLIEAAGAHKVTDAQQIRITPLEPNSIEPCHEQFFRSGACERAAVVIDEMVD